ncbi:hypothetical protein SAMN04487939_10227 [Lysobacter sp. yr284]|uniref:hypothetical protein n=1 Tax=Lysobacter sp. yr284 TaxID=1761791 RepID=UPI00089585D6|nr:hypothetical protein [Lysobacter sp. yr284]SDY41308.1 hypothetical protein SAMN04487939_10227 [Lysobacter sp. yr284]
MRNVLWIAVLAASLGAGGAAAQTPAPTGAQVRADAVQADAGAKADADAAASAANPTCLKHPGSRVPVRGKRDCAGHGRSYDRKELERTGQADVGQALRSLDPRLR